MEGKDNIKELFSQKLGNYEAKVNPELWANISAQVAAGATTTVATGLSLFTKVAIGLGISAAAITAVVILSTSSEETISTQPIIEVQQAAPNSNTKEVNKVAEIQNQETVQSTIVELDPEVNSISASIPSSPINATQGIDQTPDLTVTGMTPREAKVVGGATSEPEIVEGVSYQGMTNYGSAPANQPVITPELIEPKPEAVKRYVNVFTPNGDGRNDYFFLESEGLTDFSVVVFDPTGEIVFQSNDPDFKWDGRDRRSGEIVASGTYMYMVSAYDSEGNPYPIYERLTINR